MISSIRIGLLTCLISSQGWAFTLNSSGNSSLEGWASPDVQFMVNTSNCPASVDVQSLVEEATAVWNRVSTSNIKASYGGTTTSATFGSPPTVYCETNFQSLTNLSQDSVPGAGAVQAPQNRIVSGLLILNVSTGRGNIANFERSTLVYLMAHEIGHVLGLGHSPDVSALMYYSGNGKTQLNLSQDDIDGISYLYPSNESGGNMAGCGRVGYITPPSSGSLMLLCLFLFLPILMYSSLRKKLKVRVA